MHINIFILNQLKTPFIMKEKFLFILSAVSALMLSFSAEAAAGAYHKTYDYQDFYSIETVATEGRWYRPWRKIDLPLELKVNIVKSEKYRVELTLDDEMSAKYVSVNLKGEKLVISIDLNKGSVINATVDIYTPEIRNLNFSTITDAVVSGHFDQDSVDITLSGAASLRGLDISVRDNAQIRCSGAATMNQYTVDGPTMKLSMSGAANGRELTLKADDLTIEVSGAAGLFSSALRAKKLSTKVSGAGSVKTTEAEFDDLMASFSGASSISMKSTSKTNTLGVSGASNVTMSGTAKRINVKASGTCSVDLEELVCENAEVVASGTSEVKINVSGELRSQTSGVSSVKNYSSQK